MTVEKVLFDPSIGASMVVLKEDQGERVLPIWIGQSEALSIAMALEQVAVARPLTHDLFHSVLEGLDVSIDWVKVHSLDEGTYYATMRLKWSDKEIEIDSRPSDAIALAVRAKTPVFVAEKVIIEAIGGQGTVIPKGKEILDEDFLADLPDDIFGKYKM